MVKKRKKKKAVTKAKKKGRKVTRVSSKAAKAAKAAKVTKAARAAKVAKDIDLHLGPDFEVKEAKKAPDPLRYLVLDISDHLKMTATVSLTPRMRSDAKDGRVCIIDCVRVLAMTPKGAWSRIEEGYVFKQQPVKLDDFKGINVVEERIKAAAAAEIPEPIQVAPEEDEVEEEDEEDRDVEHQPQRETAPHEVHA